MNSTSGWRQCPCSCQHPTADQSRQTLIDLCDHTPVKNICQAHLGWRKNRFSIKQKCSFKCLWWISSENAATFTVRGWWISVSCLCWEFECSWVGWEERVLWIEWAGARWVAMATSKGSSWKNKMVWIKWADYCRVFQPLSSHMWNIRIRQYRHRLSKVFSSSVPPAVAVWRGIRYINITCEYEAQSPSTWLHDDLSS